MFGTWACLYFLFQKFSFNVLLPKCLFQKSSRQSFCYRNSVPKILVSKFLFQNFSFKILVPKFIFQNSRFKVFVSKLFLRKVLFQNFCIKHSLQNFCFKILVSKFLFFKPRGNRNGHKARVPFFHFAPLHYNIRPQARGMGLSA